MQISRGKTEFGFVTLVSLFFQAAMMQAGLSGHSPAPTGLKKQIIVLLVEVRRHHEVKGHMTLGTEQPRHSQPVSLKAAPPAHTVQDVKGLKLPAQGATLHRK